MTKKITQPIIPDWFDRESLRDFISPHRLRNLFMVSGIYPASYISKRERNGRPIKAFSVGGSKRYRPLDVIAALRADGLELEKPMLVHSKEEQRELQALKAEKARLVEEISNLRGLLLVERQNLSDSESLKSNITDLREIYIKSLFTEDEVVAMATKPEIPCGIYFIVERGKVSYIGQSVNVPSRIYQHLGLNNGGSSRFNNAKVAYIPCAPENLDILESLYIHMFRPPKNGYNGSNVPTAPMAFEVALDRISTAFELSR